MNYRPYTTYKAFGGSAVVLSALILLPALLSSNPSLPKLPLHRIILASMAGLAGIIVFIGSENKIKELKKNNHNIEVPARILDWKGLLIALAIGIALILAMLWK